MLQWKAKVFQGDSAQLTAEYNAAALAQIELLNRLLELTHEELVEGLTDE